LGPLSPSGRGEEEKFSLSSLLGFVTLYDSQMIIIHVQMSHTDIILN